VHQRGTVDQAAADPREILKRALVLGASALIIVHNHPSGDPEPSAQDIRRTNELALSARLLNIRLMTIWWWGKALYRRSWSLQREGLTKQG
jgi:DNA repair protein RadC